MFHLRDFFKSDYLLKLLLYGWNSCDEINHEINWTIYFEKGNILRHYATFHRNESCLISSDYFSVSSAPALSLVSVSSVWLSLVTVTLLSSSLRHCQAGLATLSTLPSLICLRRSQLTLDWLRQRSLESFHTSSQCQLTFFPKNCGENRAVPVELWRTLSRQRFWIFWRVKTRRQAKST